MLPISAQLVRLSCYTPSRFVRKDVELCLFLAKPFWKILEVRRETALTPMVGTRIHIVDTIILCCIVTVQHC